MVSSNPSHILIIGGGITGLLFAQALRRRAATTSTPVPTFTIYERDEHPLTRGAGWGITLHWALEDFKAIVPEYLLERLDETFVDRDAMARKDYGQFRYFSLESGQEEHRVPPALERYRMSRERLRRVLMHGLDIQWSKNIVDIQYPKDGEVIATFSDSTTATGNMLIGADGSRSQVRKVLCPETSQNYRLPIRLIGVSVPYPQELGKKFQELDTYFFQASHPKTDAYTFCSVLKVPSAAEQEASASPLPIECQILTSWPQRKGFWGKEEVIEVPKSNADRVKWMKELASNWAEPFAEFVRAIPDDAEVKTVNLEDWVPQKGAWDNKDGRVTLIGDAAHAMTMFRGEAANHGIADITSLLRQLFPEDTTTSASIKDRIDAYEQDMIERTGPAVLYSREACMDAHNYASISANSPLIARRAINANKK